MGRPTKIVVVSMLSLTHGIVSLMYALISPLMRNAPWSDTRIFPMVVLLQLAVGLLIMVAGVLVVNGLGWTFYQVVGGLQVVGALACAAGDLPASLGALPFMIPLPLAGMLLLTRPDAKWYLGVR